jgi:hypothetical protein
MGILIFLIILAIVCLIGAVFLRIAAKIVDDLDVPFGEAYATVFIAVLVGWAVGMIFGFMVRAIPELRFLSFPISLLVQAGVFAWRLSLTFGRALLISLVMLVLQIVGCFIASLLGFGIWRIIF